MGNHDCREPKAFDESINEVGQILSRFDDTETNLSATATRGPSLALYFQGYLVFQRASGVRVLSSIQKDLISLLAELGESVNNDMGAQIIIIEISANTAKSISIVQDLIKLLLSTVIFLRACLNTTVSQETLLMPVRNSGRESRFNHRALCLA